MSLFSFFRKKPKPQKQYPMTSKMLDSATFICLLIKDQFLLLEQSGGQIPSIFYKTQKTLELNQWLAGYIIGLYDAHMQLSKQQFEPNALELIFSVFYGEKSAEACVKQCFIALLTLDDEGENYFKITYGELNAARLIGGGEMFSWEDKEITCPLGIYKKYSLN